MTNGEILALLTIAAIVMTLAFLLPTKSRGAWRSDGGGDGGGD